MNYLDKSESISDISTRNNEASEYEVAGPDSTRSSYQPRIFSRREGSVTKILSEVSTYKPSVSRLFKRRDNIDSSAIGFSVERYKFA